MERVYKVYAHTNIGNNKLYIGITRLEPIQKRWRRGSTYKGSPHFYRAIQKYGWDNFKHEIILCNLTKEEAEMFEVEMIKYYRSSDRKFGYNIDLGGNSVGKVSDETRQKQSKIHTGKVTTDETKRKLSKIFSGKNNPMYGTEAPTRKSVVCLETMKVYNSVEHAAIENNIDPSSISGVCTGHKFNNSAGGLHWAHYEEWLKNPNKESYIREHSQYRPVICIETRNVYKNISEANKNFEIRGSGINKCCMKKAETCKGLHFAYYENWLLNPDPNYYIKDKKIINNTQVICIETKEVFDSIKIASQKTGAKNISSVCRKQYSQSGGFHWSYYDKWLKNPVDENYTTKKPRKNSKAVMCIEKGIVYESVKSSAEINNLCRHNIAACCRGLSKTAGGYHWKYAD